MRAGRPLCMRISTLVDVHRALVGNSAYRQARDELELQVPGDLQLMLHIVWAISARASASRSQCSTTLPTMKN